MGILIYYQVWINALRVIINTATSSASSEGFFEVRLDFQQRMSCFNSGSYSVEVATRAQHAVATTIATTTSPAKGKADSLIFLKDATVVQNACAAASAVSSPSSVFAIVPVNALSGADFMADGLRINYTIWVVSER